jgi:CheY-like chemotaxis protein
MGGGILVESKQGVGSIFTVSLSVPRVTELICSLPPPAPLTTFVDVAMKVLLVEDNLVNQKVATRFLEKLGCKITVANNGQEALDAVQAEAFEIVFMDCQMPVMDGFDATRAIRRLDGPAGRSYIVAMTANAMVGDRERCLACGMNDYVTKPLRLPVLRQLMEAVVDLRGSEVPAARGVA